MAYDLSPEADAAALKARRAGLRDFSEEIADIVAKMPMPETYLEAERGARAVWVADRVLVRMRVEMLGDVEAPSVGFADTSPASAGEEKEAEGWTMPHLMTPVRLRLRNYADRLMECAANLDKPTCYIEGERAQRYALAADRMLGQLYAPPQIATNKPAKATGRDAFGEDDMGMTSETPDYDDLEGWQTLLEAKLHKLADERRTQGRTPEAAAELAAAFEAQSPPHSSSHFSPLEGRRCREAADEGLVPSGEVAGNPSPGPSGHPLPSSGERWEMDDPPSDETPSIRVVESIFAPSGPFGKRPCNCAISAPKCGGPCPIPP